MYCGRLYADDGTEYHHGPVVNHKCGVCGQRGLHKVVYFLPDGKPTEEKRYWRKES